MTEWVIRFGLGALIVAAVTALAVLPRRARRKENGWKP